MKPTTDIKPFTESQKQAFFALARKPRYLFTNLCHKTVMWTICVCGDWIRCPVCGWTRSKKVKKKVSSVLDQMFSTNLPGYSPFFITLTVKRNKSQSLGEAEKLLKDSFQKLIRRKIWTAIGYLKTFEIAKNNVHYHIIAFAKDIDETQLGDIWSKITGGSFSVNVQANEKDDNREYANKMALKYRMRNPYYRLKNI